ncbi:hypothetical protein ACJX0J_013233, partial [Zea mays]
HFEPQFNQFSFIQLTNIVGHRFVNGRVTYFDEWGGGQALYIVLHNIPLNMNLIRMDNGA